ncbi:MAG: hypothetical protein JNL74_00980, partial [Fibrobacteres bacterium]|nr:hypothetical protein [Fibrobacterota bacterium]
MKNIFIATIALVSLNYAITVSNVVVDSLISTTETYGKVWRGIVTYDVVSDTDSVWTWIELSTDNGSTWRQDNIHAVGHIGTIPTGTARKVRWM